MKELWLFTRQFPLGRGEAFLESALPELCKHFSKVRVIPMYEGPGAVPLPKGVEELRLWRGQDAFAGLSIRDTVSRLPSLLRLMVARGAGSSGHQGGGREAFSHARQLLHKAADVEARLLPDYDPARVVLLCAWMEDWVTVLAILKERHPQLRINCLAHGWDLFEARRGSGAIPFRAMQMRAVDRVLCISEHGLRHLQQRYPQHQQKLTVARLGTADHGAAPWAPAGTLRLVSCAYLRPPKRLHLLAEALQHVQRPVHWTHFGGGPDEVALKALCATLPKHVQVELKASVPNAEVLAWYAAQPVDLCVLLSGHEGVPVSLMEAISFGVPVLVNAVGGMPELVDARTGVCLPAEVDARSLAHWLNGTGPDALLDPDFRSKVRTAWQERYSAEATYREMAGQLV